MDRGDLETVWRYSCPEAEKRRCPWCCELLGHYDSRHGLYSRGVYVLRSLSMVCVVGEEGDFVERRFGLEIQAIGELDLLAIETDRTLGWKWLLDWSSPSYSARRR